jgi:hypothetical protein
VSGRAGRLLDKVRTLLFLPEQSRHANDELRLMIGTLLAHAKADKKRYACLAELEFKVFSQFGDDGIIQYLTRHLPMRHRTFVEFGVEDYMESNTRFLLQKDNWTGLVMDGSRECIERLRRAPFFWKHDLRTEAAFITRENIGELIAHHARGWSGIDLLHIDLDGNDYWVWKALDIAPSIVIVEYNASFGVSRAVTIPYAADFRRADAHFSHLYWGASLKALHLLAQAKGYVFVGCNSAGNNAYFVRRELLNDAVPEAMLDQGYVQSKYRESRDREGRLTYLDARQRAELLRGMQVFDVEQHELVSL